MHKVVLPDTAYHFIDDSLSDVRTCLGLAMLACASGSDVADDAGPVLAIARSKLDDARRALAAAWSVSTDPGAPSLTS